jgi:hypothetical protein
MNQMAQSHRWRGTRGLQDYQMCPVAELDIHSEGTILCSNSDRATSILN